MYTMDCFGSSLVHQFILSIAPPKTQLRAHQPHQLNHLLQKLATFSLECNPDKPIPSSFLPSPPSQRKNYLLWLTNLPSHWRSRGIGQELARILYSASAKIIIASCSLPNIEKTTKGIIERPREGIKVQPPSGQIIPLLLDLGDIPTIKPAVHELKRKSPNSMRGSPMPAS